MTRSAVGTDPASAGSGPVATAALHEVELGPRVGAWFTTRAAGNLSHRRPHLPSALGRSRRAVREAIGTGPFHLMRQVHDAEVGVVTSDTPEGTELRDVDALVTAVPGRALAVQAADCVPVLLASIEGPVAAVHAGRRGLAAGIIVSALRVLSSLGAAPPTLRAAIGPAIGGCCYEVPADLRGEVAAAHPVSRATTTWGTPSLDLPAAVAAALRDAQVRIVDGAGPGDLGCTRCDPEARWFSHRADAEAGRQLGIVVRRSDGAS